MVVVDNQSNCNEAVVETAECVVSKVKSETKILNSDSSTASLEEKMKDLVLDPSSDLSKKLQALVLDKGATGEKKNDSDEEEIIVRGDHKQDEKLISRGPPGISTVSEYYADSNVNALVTAIQRSGGKRSHNEGVDPMSKGFKPEQIPQINTTTLNHLSGGTVRQGNKTVKELLAEREAERETKRKQEEAMRMQQWTAQPVAQGPQSQIGGRVPQPTGPAAIGNIPMNIAPDPTYPMFEDDQRLPSWDIPEIDAVLKVLIESEQLTEEAGLYNPPSTTQTTHPPQLNQFPQPNTQLPERGPYTTDTQLPHADIRRVRNKSISSTASTATTNPMSPAESGYGTLSEAPDSPKSDSSRPSSFEGDTLDPELEKRFEDVAEYLREKEEEERQRKQSESAAGQCSSESTKPSCQFAKVLPAAQGTPNFMDLAAPVTQAAPIQYNMQPVTFNFSAMSAPKIIPPVPHAGKGGGKGRPPNSKGQQTVPRPPRPILPKPEPTVQIIPTTVATLQTSVAPSNVTAVPRQVPAQSSLTRAPVVSRQQVQEAPRPIAPKPPQPRGDSLITRTVTDILTDSKLKIRAHRQIVGKPLDEILKPDADGDMWLHSYIMYLNENQDVLYMINAIINRLQREHTKGNINIRRELNAQNNSYQTPVYLATVMNNQYVLDWLLKAGGDPNIVASSNTPSGTVRKGPLHYAASRGDECLDVLFALLECRDTDLNLKNTEGLSPLHVAVLSHGKPIPKTNQVINSTRVIAALIQKGANLDEVDDKNGKTPIHYLVETQSYELINAIFNVIPESDLKRYLRKMTYQNNTALHIAAQCAMANKDEHKKIVKLLLDKGADPTLKNSENQTASTLVYKPNKDELAPLLKASHGKSIHNQSAWAPNTAPVEIKPAPRTLPVSTVNAPAAGQTYIVVNAVPGMTAQVLPVQGVAQPVQSQMPIVTIPQNTVLAQQPINCTMANRNQEVIYARVSGQVQPPQQQNCYTSPINSPVSVAVRSPQMAHTSPINSPVSVALRSPQMAQSPPQVNSPEMAQANHDFTLVSQPGPNSPPQVPGATTYVGTQQTNTNQIYQITNVVRQYKNL